MKSFAILTDPVSDLDAALQQKNDIQLVPGYMTMPGVDEARSALDWDTWPRDKFYADLRKNPEAFITAPPNVNDWTEALDKVAAEGKDALILCMSAALSGTYDFAVLGAKAAMEAHPEMKVEVIDSMRFGPAIGLMAEYAANLRAEGKGLDETAAWLTENRNRFHQCGWLDDLTYVAKKGRLNNFAAFFGTLAGIKPMGEFDKNGMTTVLAKFKGAKAAYPFLLHYIEKTIEDPENQVIVVAQTNRLAQAEEYKKMIEEKFHPKAVEIRQAYMPSSINVGPGLMAAYYVGKPISEDLVEEKAIVEAYNAK